jgi:mannobiose 2-epimerase
MTPTSGKAWAAQFRNEIEGNILRFWTERAVDHGNGGFYGLIDSAGRVDEKAPKAAVIHARALWTFSTACRLLGERYRTTAEHAFAYLSGKFWDAEKGGLFWMLDYRGRPLAPRKQIYAQAFGIYAFAEYHRATGDALSLDIAKKLFRLVEEHSYDPLHGGYIEALDRDWQPLQDMRLSDKDLNAPKSMNTHLHVLEAYTNLLRVWRDPGLAEKQGRLLNVMLERIVDPKTAHFKLFFDRQWTTLSDRISFGHDIEGSWLMVEAADVLGDGGLLARARKTAVAMAEAVRREGLDRDGSVFYEADCAGRLVDPSKHWWVEAEGVIGFYNAYEISGDPHYLKAARKAWNYIEEKVVDRLHGEWHAKLTREGVPLTEAEDPDAVLAGLWKCPYHNARLCYEMMERLENAKDRKVAL